MSVDNDTLPDADHAPAPIVFSAPERRHRLRRRGQRPPRPKVRKLRLLFVVVAFLGLATISVLFGVLTSIASDLPQLEHTVQFRGDVDSYLYDDQGQPIGVLAPPTKTAIDKWNDISPNMVHAIVAVEDKRFWGSTGVDVKGLARAAVSDVTGGQHEGGSTIPEEFIKIVRSEENHRTIFEKLIEAGMAFQLTHKWTHAHILTEYLNSIYFGNGAVGIESAARVYFGWNHGYKPTNPADEGKNGCGDPDTEDPHRDECADVLRPWEAALLAGMVANPTAYNPLGTGPEQAAATARRNTVLKDMWQQDYISQQQYQKGIDEPLPTAQQVQQPQEPVAAPYFTSWVRPQIIHALKKEGVAHPEYEAYYGGLKIKLTIDLSMQKAAQQIINEEFPAGENGPTATLVAIDNRTGEVRAMVSGNGNFQQSPFNLATLGYRQPGSSFKIFTLAAALSSGDYSPYSEFDSHQVTIPFVKKDGNSFYAANGTGQFPVHNFGNEYAGTTSLSTATATSDNSVFAQLGLSDNVGTARVKHYAQLLGIRSPISVNPSMILGGLNTGVSALDMAHAYSTVANGGKKVYNNTLGDMDHGPVGIHSISGCNLCDDKSKILNNPRTEQVISPTVASTIDELLHGPVDDSYGTGTAAAIPGVDIAGKTGTTSNYVDAWFVGWSPTLTVAVWVGYPNSGKPMTTNYGGKPVEGGTYPAVIFHAFMTQAIGVMDAEAQHKTPTLTNTDTTQLTPAYTAPSTSTSTVPSTATTTSTTPVSQNTGGTQVPTTQTPQTDTPSNSGATSTPTQNVPSTGTSAPPPPPSAPTTGSNGGSGL